MLCVRVYVRVCVRGHVLHVCVAEKKDDVTELHCVTRSKLEARGSERFEKEEKDLMDTWVSGLGKVFTGR